MKPRVTCIVVGVEKANGGSLTGNYSRSRAITAQREERESSAERLNLIHDNVPNAN